MALAGTYARMRSHRHGLEVSHDIAARFAIMAVDRRRQITLLIYAKSDSWRADRLRDPKPVHTQAFGSRRTSPSECLRPSLVEPESIGSPVPGSGRAAQFRPVAMARKHRRDVAACGRW